MRASRRMGSLQQRLNRNNNPMPAAAISAATNRVCSRTLAVPPATPGPCEADADITGKITKTDAAKVRKRIMRRSLGFPSATENAGKGCTVVLMLHGLHPNKEAANRG